MICVLQEIRKRKIEKVCPFQFDQFSNWHSISSSKRIRWNYQMCVRVCVCVCEREREREIHGWDFLLIFYEHKPKNPCVVEETKDGRCSPPKAFFFLLSVKQQAVPPTPTWLTVEIVLSLFWTVPKSFFPDREKHKKSARPLNVAIFIKWLTLPDWRHIYI